MIEKNCEYDIDIIDVNHEGQGVGKIENYTVFVGNVLILVLSSLAPAL